MKKLLLPLMLFASLSVQAGEKGNGGETIDVNGVPRLRDLVEKTTCSWTKGPELVKENPLVNEILRRLARVDWYFAAELKTEILDLDYCLTGPLVRVDTSDPGAIIAVYGERTHQVAIRVNRQVYIDYPHMKNMPEIDRAMLLVHESMHSYLRNKEHLRNHKLRSIVRSIYDVFQGIIITTEVFHNQMKQNSIIFPRTATELKPLKQAVMFLISDPMTRREMLMKSPLPAALIQQVSRIRPELLVSWHADLLQERILPQILYQSLIQDDLELVQKLLSEEALKEEVMTTLYASPMVQETVKIKEFVVGQENVEIFIQSVLQDLSQRKVMLSSTGRLLIPGMELLSQNGYAGKNMPFISLDAVDELELHPKMVLYVSFISSLMEQNDLVTLERVSFGNENFYTAFTINGLAETILSAKVPSKMEEGVAVRKIHTLIEGFWGRVRSFLISRHGEEKWRGFASKVEETKLGYRLN